MRLILGMGAALALLVLVGNARAEEADGKLALDQVPKAVKNTVKAQYPQAQIQSAEMQERNGQTTYLLTIKQGERERKVRVALEARIVSEGRAVTEGSTGQVITEGSVVDESTLMGPTDEPTTRRRGLLRRGGGERRFSLLRRGGRSY